MVRNCRISLNGVGGSYNDVTGGGVYIGSGSIVQNSIIMSNSTAFISYFVGIGGGVYMETGGKIRNCLVWGNLAEGWGGGIAGGLTENCTIVGNIARSGTAGYSGGVYEGVLTNCIIISNLTQANSSVPYVNGNFSAGSIISYSCTMPLAPGAGNIDSEPQFVNFAAGDFHLQSTSPCRSTGINLDWMNAAKDLDGNNRIMGGIVDRGAYEVIE
jgi:hypothetical protein